MSAFKTLRLPLVLAVIAVVGIVGMLLFHGSGDVTAFVLAALPLLAGIGAFVWQRQEKH